MYIIDVIALSPTSPAAPLTYRSKESLKPGTIVSIQLRKTQTHGIVVGSTEVRDAKALLKSADFAVAKSVTRTDGMLPKVLIDAATAIASYHAASLGSVFHALLSDAMATDLPRILTEGKGFKEHACEFPRSERFRKYEHIVDEMRDEKRATLLVLPTIAEFNEAKEYFKSHNPILLSGDIKPELRRGSLNAAAETIGLIIATPAFSFVMVKALGHIIVERPSAGTYRMPQRPNLDRVHSLLFLAKARNLAITLGDYPLPLEYRSRPERALQTEPKGTVDVVDVRAVRAQGEVWKALPDSTLKEIKSVLKDNGRVVVLAARKGYAPSVVCRDCGQALRDEHGRNYAFATVGGKRVFRTADGSVSASEQKTCPNCGSWNLMPLGVGIERVYEELQAAFPETSFTQFDTDLIKTDAAARKAMKQMREHKGILAGTEAMLPWLTYGLPKDKQYELSVIASADSLLSLPFWRARERFIRVGLMLREQSERLLIHTRQPGDTALKAVTSPKEETFFKDETTLREALTYPPFGTLIAFHVEGSQKRLLEAKIVLTRAVLPYPLTLLPERIVEKNTYHLAAILHVPKSEWPEEELSNRIQALPPFVKVVLDPESFW